MIALACHPVTNHGFAYITCTLALIIVTVIRVCNRPSLRASFVYLVVPSDDFCIDGTRPMAIESLQSLREVGSISDSHILLYLPAKY